MKILLTGASGFIGRNLLARLQHDGHAVVAVSRSHGMDMTTMHDAADWEPLLRDVDAAINTVGIIGESARQRFETLHTAAPIALFDACLVSGVRRVIQVSALGADDSAFSAYHLSKKAADDHLRNLNLDWYVLRPSLVYGRGGTSSEMFRRLARLPLLPVVGDGRQLLQPIHVSEVIETILLCLRSPGTRVTLDIVGNEDIEFAEWLQRLRLAQGLRRAGLLRAPVPIALAAAWLGQWISPMLRTENIRMLATGYLGNGRTWEEFMGRPALSFAPGLIDIDALTQQRRVP